VVRIRDAAPTTDVMTVAVMVSMSLPGGPISDLIGRVPVDKRRRSLGVPICRYARNDPVDTAPPSRRSAAEPEAKIGTVEAEADTAISPG
jgi:hypothetical protein